MELSNSTHGSARASNLESHEDNSSNSLLELVPSLEHSIVGILNHNGELTDHGTGNILLE
jgi:hypothetical protein